MFGSGGLWFAKVDFIPALEPERQRRTVSPKQEYTPRKHTDAVFVKTATHHQLNSGKMMEELKGVPNDNQVK